MKTMQHTKFVRVLAFGAMAVVVFRLVYTGYTDIRAAATLEIPVRGMPGDWWADVVLGHLDFSEITPNEVTSSRVFNVGGVIVDRSVRPNRVYVFDGGNSRVLGLSHLGYVQRGPNAGKPCTSNSDYPGSFCVIQEGIEADLVLGQPSLFGHSACNGDGNFQNYPNRAPASASTLCNLPEDQISTLEGGAFGNMAVDPQGNLYVTDWWNHRVLRYNSPFGTDTIADYVWGQPDFSGKECNQGRGLTAPSNSSLCFVSPYGEGATGGAAVDQQGNLWVTDNQNCRVLRFPINPGTGIPDHTADLVLGQPNFTSSGCGSAMDRMFAPAAVRVDATGSVYVADSLNNRVLVFDPPFSSGMSATRLLGENLRFPTGLEVNPGGGIWVVDNGNHQVLLFEGGAVTKVLLKDVPTYDGECGGYFTCSASGPCVMCDSRASIGIDVDGNIILADSNGTQDVWHFAAPLPDPTPGTAYSTDARLFKPNVWGVHNHLSPAGLDSPRGIAVSDQQLIVADGGRILFWNSLFLLKNGRPADGCVGVPNCYSRVYPPYGRLKADKNHHLWTVKEELIQVYALPLTAGAQPILTISPPLPAKGGGVFTWTTFANVGGIAVSPDGEQVWLTDPATHRAFRINHALSDPVVDIVLGQTNLTGDQCNRSQSLPGADTLCAPGAVALDPWGNLYVSDHAMEISGNHRLLEWDAALIPVEPATAQFAIPATRVFGTGNSFTTSGCIDPQDPMCMPLEPAFDSTGRMVIGLNGYSGRRFPIVYTNPLSQSLPDATLKDFHSMPYATAFDDRDNLYMVDGNRHRVFIYWMSPWYPYRVYIPKVSR